jgi:hypothetical protein
MKTNAFFAIIIATALWRVAASDSRAQDIDSMAPVVVKTVPEAGSQNVPPGEYEIKVKFSKKMTDHSWSWSTAWKDSVPEAIGKPHYEADHQTCVMKVKLEPGKTYGWWLNSGKFQGFKDTQNHPAVPYLLSFKTAAAPVDRRAQVIVEDLALHMIVAIREKNDDKLREFASDRIKGWRDALPEFAVELREHYRQSTGNEAFDLRVNESLVDGDLAVVRCTGPAELKGKCLALYFVKTKDGWRNHSLRAATEDVPLQNLMDVLKKQIHAAAPDTDTPKIPASETPEKAVAAAEAWLAGIDGGNYAQSWKDAAVFFRNSITEAGWSESMENLRKPLGALKSRKLLNAQSAKSLPGAPDGEYVVMQFESSFAAKENAVETVTFSQEKDGTWRASGYFIR